MEGASSGGLFHYRLNVKPMPTPRPRVARTGGVFYPKTYQEYYREIQRQSAQAAASSRAEGHSERLLEGRLCVLVDVAVRRPKATTLRNPRGDADNYAKGVLDAASAAGLFTDDDQVEALVTIKRWAEEAEDEGVNVWAGRLAV